MEQSFSQSFWFIWIILPTLIFLARIVDVSLQTIRIISISRGIRWLAPLVGFFEVLIWLLAIGQIMKTISHPVAYIAYAAGFATGTAIGQVLERKLTLGMVIVRVITPRDGPQLCQALHELGFGFTAVPGHGAAGAVEVIFTVLRRQHLQQVLTVIRESLPDAFYSIEEVASARATVYPLSSKSDPFRLFRLFSKRK
ncbi:MAG: DUF2179 domain-containing protein [Candidatus Aminicenantes bacterium]|nr:DUF2179 domain-containing protein [Candidatus Aminicenantes bacterium]